MIFNKELTRCQVPRSTPHELLTREFNETHFWRGKKKRKKAECSLLPRTKLYFEKAAKKEKNISWKERKEREKERERGENLHNKIASLTDKIDELESHNNGNNLITFGAGVEKSETMDLTKAAVGTGIIETKVEIRVSGLERIHHPGRKARPVILRIFTCTHKMLLLRNAKAPNCFHHISTRLKPRK